MQANIISLHKDGISQIDLPENIYGMPIRKDILHRMVEWQRAKRQAGTHKTKGISDISGTTAKPYKQKGTGRARQGSLRSPQFRGGAVIFGPLVRSHAFNLTKKFRKLALKTALSAKYAAGQLLILEDTNISSPKTKELVGILHEKIGASALIIDGVEQNENFKLAVSNIKHYNYLSFAGLNVYDVLKSKKLVVTQAALSKIEERFAS